VGFPDRIERTVELKQGVETVWEALTTAEGLGGWFGSKAEVDLREGGEAHVEWEQFDNAKATLAIKVVERPTRFAYTWSIEGLPADDPRRTYVEFTLEPTDTGTRLTVVETGFAQLPEERYLAAYEGNSKGWISELDELVAYLDAA
jgi:uncharacterized protein YndB with AHSA1/START domain